MPFAFLFGRKVALDAPLSKQERGTLMYALGVNLLLPVISPVWVVLARGSAMPHAARLCGRKIWLDVLFLLVELLILPLPLVTWLFPTDAINLWVLLGGMIVWVAAVGLVWLWWKVVTVLALRAVEKGFTYRFPIVG
jgi:hypothetical protein